MPNDHDHPERTGTTPDRNLDPDRQESRAVQTRRGAGELATDRVLNAPIPDPPRLKTD